MSTGTIKNHGLTLEDADREQPNGRKGHLSYVESHIDRADLSVHTCSYLRQRLTLVSIASRPFRSYCRFSGCRIIREDKGTALLDITLSQPSANESQQFSGNYGLPEG